MEPDLSGIDPDVVPEGIDPNNAFRVEITVNAYFSVWGTRKEYNRGRTVSWLVDPGEYTISDLEKDINPYFKWGNDQEANFWVMSGNNMTCKLASDAQLLDLLRASRLVQLFMVVGRRGDSMLPAVNIRDEIVPAAVNVGEEILPAAVNEGDEDVLAVADNDLEVLDGGFAWAEAPKYGETIAGPPVAEEEEKEHFMTVGCDPTADEPAGGDEEWRYFKNVDPIENVEAEVHKRKRAKRAIMDFDNEDVPGDKTTMLDDFIVPQTSHDKENPIIKEGDTFVDKNAFVHTIRQYAIKNEFETRIEHSDKKRYRARCADENCDWRVFAKVLHGCNTFKVVKLSELGYNGQS